MVVLGFMPLMIITGIVQNKILTGFAKGDKASLDGAGQVGFSMHLLTDKDFVFKELVLKID